MLDSFNSMMKLDIGDPPSLVGPVQQMSANVGVQSIIWTLPQAYGASAIGNQVLKRLYLMFILPHGSLVMISLCVSLGSDCPILLTAATLKLYLWPSIRCWTSCSVQSPVSVMATDVQMLFVVKSRISVTKCLIEVPPSSSGDFLHKNYDFEST